MRINGIGVHWDHALTLAAKYNLNTFVETGTWKGKTALWATEHFDQVVTIEGDHDRYAKTVAGFAGNIPDNLALIQGDSRTALERVLSEIERPCLLWLDAHWCGGGAAEAFILEDECPLLDELKAVLNSRFVDQHIVMIDDARLFTAPPPYPHHPEQWPTYDQIAALLAPRRVYILEDVIYAEPDAEVKT